eukprot:gene5977-4286_t
MGPKRDDRRSRPNRVAKMGVTSGGTAVSAESSSAVAIPSNNSIGEEDAKKHCLEGDASVSLRVVFQKGLTGNECRVHPSILRKLNIEPGAILHVTVDETNVLLEARISSTTPCSAVEITGDLSPVISGGYVDISAVSPSDLSFLSSAALRITLLDTSKRDVAVEGDASHEWRGLFRRTFLHRVIYTGMRTTIQSSLTTVLVEVLDTKVVTDAPSSKSPTIRGGILSFMSCLLMGGEGSTDEVVGSETVWENTLFVGDSGTGKTYTLTQEEEKHRQANRSVFNIAVETLGRGDQEGVSSSIVLHETFERARRVASSWAMGLLARGIAEEIRAIRESNVDVVVVASAPSLQSLPLVLRGSDAFGRSTKKLEIPWSIEEKARCLQSCLREVLGKDIVSEEDCTRIAAVTNGYSQRDFHQLAELAAARSFQIRCNLECTAEDLFSCAQKIQPSSLRQFEISIPDVTWSDIGGSEEAKHVLQEVVRWALGDQSEVFREYNLQPPRGVLLYGPPGCSKTMLAKALANESKLNFISVKGPEVFSKWVGDSEKAVRNIFTRARAASPCVVFIDELDGMCGHRGQGGVSDRVISQFLTELDGLPSAMSDRDHSLIFVGATNRPDNIDGAVLRPGRIDKLVHVGLPRKEERRAIVNIQFRHLPVSPDLTADFVADLTDGYSGAEVVAVVKEAAFHALAVSIAADCLSKDDVLEALKKVKPRTKPEDVECEGAFSGYAFIKRVMRATLCGLLFAVPIAAAVPTSPLMRLSMSKNNQKTILTRMMTDFFYVNFFASFVSYALFIETRLDTAVYGSGVLPVLGPLAAQIPGVACLVTSHLFYPGAWALINETTWKARRQTFLRLNLKCFFAFAPYHVPAVVSLGVVVGSLLYPFKYYKRSRSKGSLSQSIQLAPLQEKVRQINTLHHWRLVLTGVTAYTWASCSLMDSPPQTVCKIEVLGRVAALSHSQDANSILASTVLNGCHIFNLNDEFYGTKISAGIGSGDVESYPFELFGKKPFLSSCFLNSGKDFVMGSATGDVVAVSRTSRQLLRSFVKEDKSAIRSLHCMTNKPSCFLLCTDAGAEIIDVSEGLLASFDSPTPRCVGALCVDTNSVAVANYDGKVLVFDVRNTKRPESILSVPDQICSFSMCTEQGTVCCGTVGGRIFTLRCGKDSVTREEAFATGKTRSPIRALAVHRTTVTAGDVSGRLSVLDISDVPNPTTYWTPKRLFSSGRTAVQDQLTPNWDNAEVTATTITGGAAWASFAVHGMDQSYIVAVPFQFLKCLVLLKTKNPFETLGLPRTATKVQVKNAYRQLAKEFHPDATGGDSTKMERINQAYKWLMKEGGFEQLQQKRTGGGKRKTVVHPFSDETMTEGSPLTDEEMEKWSALDPSSERRTPSGKYMYQNRDDQTWVELDRPLLRANQPRYASFGGNTSFVEELRRRQMNQEREKNEKSAFQRNMDKLAGSADLPSRNPYFLRFYMVLLLIFAYMAWVRTFARQTHQKRRTDFYVDVEEKREKLLHLYQQHTETCAVLLLLFTMLSGRHPAISTLSQAGRNQLHLICLMTQDELINLFLFAASALLSSSEPGLCIILYILLHFSFFFPLVLFIYIYINPLIIIIIIIIASSIICIAPDVHTMDGERDSSIGDSGSDSSSDDEWGSINLADQTAFRDESLPKCFHQLESCMFIPEPILSLESTNEKPKLRFLSAEELPPGSTVWVGDEEDVQMYIKKHWNVFYEKICNGRQAGTVSRHSNDMSLVAFRDEATDVYYSLTLPRSCLSLTKIEPYSSSARKTDPELKEEVLRTYYGRLNPRNTRTTSRESQIANQLFYEAVSVSAICTSGCPALEQALQEFHAGSFSKAMITVNNLLSSDSVYPPRRIDVYLLRSRLFVFQNKYAEAMEDARRCIVMEPRWVRGYLSAARALSGLGDFDGAHKMIVFASSILPYTTELRHIMELNTFLRHQQKRLGKDNYTLSIDHLYRKRIKPKKKIAKDEVMVMETMPSVIASSLFASWPPHRCKRCFKEYHVTSQESTDSDLDDIFSKPVCLENIAKAIDNFDLPPGYCSLECHDNAKSENRLRYEYQKQIQQAHAKLRSIASLIIDSRPLEIGKLTIRLFFIVVQKHKHLLETIAKRRRSVADFLVWSEGTDPPLGQRYTPSLNAALRQTGFFPLVSGHVGDYVKEIVLQVYEILVEPMNDEEKKLYNEELFLGLYRYVHAYYTSIKLNVFADQKVPDKFFFIPRFVGSIWGRSEIEWLARVEIDTGNWSSESQFEFSLRTATNCHVELIDLHSRTEEERKRVINYLGSTSEDDLFAPVLALVAKKSIEPNSMLVPL